MSQLPEGAELPNESRDIQRSLLITTLAAVDDNVTRIAREEPNTKMGAVIFSDKVYVAGDGTQPVLQVDSVNDKDKITAFVNNKASHMISKPISQTETHLHNLLMNIKTEGATALGPAALTSILLANKHKLGSNVVICTDGEANTGLGSFNFNRNGGEAFYEYLGQLAAESGVTVNLIAVVGSQCNV